MLAVGETGRHHIAKIGVTATDASGTSAMAKKAVFL
jgi:hypothetical protein